jgi:hypothetical protein
MRARSNDKNKSAEKTELIKQRRSPEPPSAKNAQIKNTIGEESPRERDNKYKYGRK